MKRRAGPPGIESRKGVSKAQLRQIVLSFAGASEGTSYGKPAFLVCRKFFTRLRVEDDSLVLIVGSMDERDMLLESDPALFHVTDHYRNYPAVLARVERLESARLQAMLERRWRAIAPRTLVKRSDQERECDTDRNDSGRTRSNKRRNKRSGS